MVQAIIVAVQIGDIAPDFKLEDLHGNIHTLESYRGQVIILDFWSCTCPHVDRTDGLIRNWWHERGQREISVLRIASNASESKTALVEAAGRKNIPLILHDRGHVVADLYEAQTTPHIFVIEAGRLRYRGAVDDTTFARRVPTRFFLLEAVDALMAGNTPPVSETEPYGCAIIREALE